MSEKLASPTIAEQDAIIGYLRTCSEADLREKMRDKEYRYLVNDVFGYWRIRHQIRVIREQRGYSQEELGRRAGMKQSFISRLENIYLPEELTVNTLQRIARALDVRLSLKFTSWGEALREILNTMNPLRVAGFQDSMDGLSENESK